VGLSSKLSNVATASRQASMWCWRCDYSSVEKNSDHDKIINLGHPILDSALLATSAF
jgi:hypothetical protein